MTTIDLFSLRWELLAGACALGFTLALTGIWRVARVQRRIERRCVELSGDLRGLRGELSGNGAAVTALGAHLERLVQQLSIDARHLGAAHVPDSRGLDLAVRSARQGATDEDLIADYGMSRQEAAFLRRIHGAAAPAAARRAVS